MSGIATAVVGSAVIGAYASNKGSSKAADVARATSDDQLAYMAAAEEQAREDINRLFPMATQRRAEGFQQSLDLYKSALPLQMNLARTGNVGAQQVLRAAMPQVQNALMGAPVDYSAFNARKQDWNPSNFLNSQSRVPDIYDPADYAEPTDGAGNSGGWGLGSLAGLSLGGLFQNIGTNAGGTQPAGAFNGNGSQYDIGALGPLNQTGVNYQGAGGNTLVGGGTGSASQWGQVFGGMGVGDALGGAFKASDPSDGMQQRAVQPRASKYYWLNMV